MRSLFLKIFLWFWLAMTLATLVWIVLTLLALPPAHRTGVRLTRRGQLPRHLRASRDILRRDGRTAALEYVKRIEETTETRMYVFDGEGNEVRGRAVPDPVVQLRQRALEHRGTQFGLGRMYVVAAQGEEGPDGAPYVFVAERRDYQVGQLYPSGRSIALRYAAALAAAGVICYILTRYLAGPLVRLRAATQRLASGDLSVRMGDVVGRRRDEIGGLARDFDRMAEQVELVMSNQRNLLRDISHELRSPLTRLNVALELTRKSEGGRTETGLNRIEREAQRLNELISQLLSLARLETGIEGIPPEPVDLSALVYEIAADADFEARQGDCGARVSYCEPCTTTGVMLLLRSAIENVVRNAVCHTTEGSDVEITLAPDVTGGGSQAVIRVRDHGDGVPPEMLTEIFRPFHRVEGARNRETGGAGLGLAISKRAVQAHGGTITAANADDGGLIVEIRLPAVSASGASDAPAPSKAPSVTGGAAS